MSGKKTRKARKWKVGVEYRFVGSSRLPKNDWRYFCLEVDDRGRGRLLVVPRSQEAAWVSHKLPPEPLGARAFYRKVRTVVGLEFPLPPRYGMDRAAVRPAPVGIPLFPRWAG